MCYDESCTRKGCLKFVVGLLIHTFFTNLHNSLNLLRFQVLAVASTKMAVFWDVAPCSLVEVY
jgi:hypothetical protein